MKQRFLKYPKTKKYKVLQSKIRYQYKTKDLDANAILTNRSIVNAILARKKYVAAFHYVNPCILIPSFNMFIDILKKLDEKSRELNGWKSAHLTIINAKEMLEAIRKKFRDKTSTKRWMFRNEHTIYELLNITKSKTPHVIKELFFGIWIACSKYDTEGELIMLRDVIEGLSKSQMMYHIAMYKSRKNRNYILPWEVVENPLNDWKKFNSSDRIQNRINHHKAKRYKYIMTQNNTSDITTFFKITNKKENDKQYKEGMQRNNSRKKVPKFIPSIHIPQKIVHSKLQPEKKRTLMCELMKRKKQYLKHIVLNKYETQAENRETTQELLDELEESSEEL